MKFDKAKFDKAKIGKILSDIRKYSNDLEAQRIKSKDDLKRKDKFYICSMLVFSIVNSAIDLGNEIISSLKLELPQSYKDVFEILRKNKLISEKDERDLIYLVRIRNAIAHRYFAITPEKLFVGMNKLKAVKNLEKIIDNLLIR